MYLSIVTPIYNDQENIKPFINKVSQTLKKINLEDYEIIFVLDKSEDNSFLTLKEIALNNRKIKILHLSKRYGHQESLIAGLEHSLNSDFVITMDCDSQHPYDLIPLLLNKINDGYDVVTTKRNENKDQGLWRNLFGNIFYKFSNLISDTKVENGSADFRVMNKKFVNNLITKFPEREIFLRGLVAWVGYNHALIEYSAQKREFGVSKFNHFKKIQFAVTGLMSLSTRPLYLSIFFGVLFAFSSILILLFIVSGIVIFDSISTNWILILSIFLLTSSIQFFMIGIIGFYIGSIFKEIKNRPRYLIQDKINFDDE